MFVKVGTVCAPGGRECHPNLSGIPMQGDQHTFRSETTIVIRTTEFKINIVESCCRSSIFCSLLLWSLVFESFVWSFRFVKVHIFIDCR